VFFIVLNEQIEASWNRMRPYLIHEDVQEIRPETGIKLLIGLKNTQKMKWLFK
jgi:hypothetical protein